jgi:hypothetical protein
MGKLSPPRNEVAELPFLQKLPQRCHAGHDPPRLIARPITPRWTPPHGSRTAEQHWRRAREQSTVTRMSAPEPAQREQPVV